MKITLYAIVGSPFCQQAKDYLTSLSLPFEEKDVEFNKDNLNEMLNLSDHFTGVPFVHVMFDDNSEAGLKGFTKEEFDQAFATASSTPVPVAAEEPAQDMTPASAPAPTVTEPDFQPVEQHDDSPAEQHDDSSFQQDTLTQPEPVVSDDEIQQQQEPEEVQLGSVMDNLAQQSKPLTDFQAPTQQPVQQPTELPQETSSQQTIDNIQTQSQSASRSTSEEPQPINPTIPDFPQ